MRRDVQEFVSTCLNCQKHARKTTNDRIPISAMPRSQCAFEVLNVDLVGELQPHSSAGDKYILCVIDNCSKWIEAVPLKTLKAKEVCDQLLLIFTCIGIPRLLISDNGTNMVAEINVESNARLGIEMRQSPPLMPQRNASVERFNQTLKRALHHVMLGDKAREWHRILPYLLWALRTIPSRTTGLSPYQLVYGRLARGPLNVLQETWGKRGRDDVDLDPHVFTYL